MATAEQLLTAEEYLRLPDNGRPTELVRGRLVEMNPPYPRHGQVCAKVARLLGNHAEDKNLGHVLTNDSGVVTERDPDTVRGADVAFYSYEDVPRGPLPQKYLNKLPRLVVEVFSPSDRWKEVQVKVVEYLEAGVADVCVLDPEDGTAYVYSQDRPVRIIAADQEFAVSDVLPDFQVPVQRFLE